MKTSAAVVGVALLRVSVAWADEGPVQRWIELDELPGYLAERDVLGDRHTTFWVTVERGAVVRLDEQYRP